MKKNFVFKPGQSPLFKYLVVGCFNTGIDYAAFLFCFYVLHIDLVISNTLAFCLASVNSYFWNARWSFSRAWHELGFRNFSKFFAVNVTAFLAATAALWILAHFMPTWIAKIGSVAIVLVINYSGFSKIVFRPPPPANEP